MGGPVTVYVSADSVIVSNQAQAFTDDELARMRQRFHRADNRSPGSGLGLSIVERLLGHMKASLELGSRTEHGQTLFAAVIRFS